jgi:hypothetical protein
MRTRSTLQLLALTFALLSLCACPAAPSIINLISIAIDAGSSVLAVAGVIPPSVATYIQQGEQALAFATTELATTDTDVVKMAKITDKFLSLASPDLTGASPYVVIGVAAFAATLHAVLAFIQAGQSQAKMTANGGVPPPKDATITLPSPSQNKTLLKLHARALAVAAQANAIVTK